MALDTSSQMETDDEITHTHVDKNAMPSYSNADVEMNITDQDQARAAIDNLHHTWGFRLLRTAEPGRVTKWKSCRNTQAQPPKVPLTAAAAK